MSTATPISSFVDGRASTDAAGTLTLLDPATGKPSGFMSIGSDLEIERATTSARLAFDDGRWRNLPPSVRSAILERFAELVAAHADTLDALDALDMGKPVSLQLFNATAAASLLKYYATALTGIAGQVLTSDHNSYVTQRWAPRGVVAAIVPWNFPTYIAALKIGPALTAGNSVILKPSEMSPRSAIRLGELAVEAGVPAGVLNVVLGRGDSVGRALGLHPAVDMLTFTGSTDVGKLMLQYAGQSNLKAVVAECGGKSPQVVFDDGVDLDAAADGITGLLLSNQGQVCSLGSRLLVQRSIERELLVRIGTRMASIVVGDPREPATTFGPLASARQLARVMDYVEGAAEDGAELVAGGRRLREDSGGFFVEPTLFRNVAPACRLAQEEVFGPVLSVTPFDDEADAIRLANGTAFGLAAYVWTADLARAMRMQNIQSSVWVSACAPTGEGAGHALSIEPYGLSGLGVEGGLPGLQTYMRRQTLAFQFG